MASSFSAGGSGRFGFPPRLFACNCYPSNVRINSYSRPQYLLDVLSILHGTPDLQRLLSSPLGSLFNFLVSETSFSGQLLHQLLCRQLCTSREHELWFVFGGHPLRFSLQEFESVTGFSCSVYPDATAVAAACSYADGGSPYWYKLIGGDIGSVTIEAVVNRLKTDKTLPRWKKFRLCLIVIVEGVLICSSQPVKPSVRFVEMVKDVEFFLSYPWGRLAFEQTILMIKASLRPADRSSLVSRMKQCSMVVHGFPLAIQLWAFHVIPGLRSLLPPADDGVILSACTVSRLPTLKCFHSSNILAIECTTLAPLFLPRVSVLFGSDATSDDPSLARLEASIREGFQFSNSVWSGGDASVPPLIDPRKRSRCGIESLSNTSSDTSDSDGAAAFGSPRRHSHDAALDAVVSAKLASFKKEIISEVRELLLPLVPSSHLPCFCSTLPERDVPVPDTKATSGPPCVSPCVSAPSSPAHRPSVSLCTEQQGPISEPRCPRVGVRRSPRLLVHDKHPISVSSLDASDSPSSLSAAQLAPQPVFPSDVRVLSSSLPPLPDSPMLPAHPSPLRSPSAMPASPLATRAFSELEALNPTSLPRAADLTARPHLPVRITFCAAASSHSGLPPTLADSSNRLSDSVPGSPSRGIPDKDDSAFGDESPVHFQQLKLSLTPVSDRTSSLFSAIVSRFTLGSTSIGGFPCAPTFFEDLVRPQRWISSLHMDFLVRSSLNRYGAFLSAHRTTFHDSLFSSFLVSQHLAARDSASASSTSWNPLLLRCVSGTGSGPTPALRWFHDLDYICLPMNWGSKHWVALCIDLRRLHISILDSFASYNPWRKVVTYMQPFLQSLWSLLLSIDGVSSFVRDRPPFTFSRVPGLPQNSKGGDCGPLTMKFMELHSRRLMSEVETITDDLVAAIRVRYAMDLHNTFVRTP